MWGFVENIFSAFLLFDRWPSNYREHSCSYFSCLNLFHSIRVWIYKEHLLLHVRLIQFKDVAGYEPKFLISLINANVFEPHTQIAAFLMQAASCFSLFGSVSLHHVEEPAIIFGTNPMFASARFSNLAQAKIECIDSGSSILFEHLGNWMRSHLPNRRVLK